MTPLVPAARPGGPELVVEGVTRVYAGGVRALDHASLRVGPGELVLLTGRSGAGKSTLLDLIAGLTGPTRAGSRWMASRSVSSPTPTATGAR